MNSERKSLSPPHSETGEAKFMKVTIVTTRAFHLHHLAKGLLDRGHDVQFHTLLPQWKTRRYGLPDANVRSYFLALLPASAIALLRLRTPRAGNWRMRALGLLRLKPRLDRMAARRITPSDVFIGLSSVAVESARSAKADGAVVLIERGATHIHEQCDVARSAGLPLPDTEYIERELASYDVADKVVLLSRHAQASFLKQGEDAARLRVTPLGVDTDRFHPPSQSKQQTGLAPSALYVGPYTHRKGCDMIATLMAAEPHLRVTHVGAGGDVPFPQSAQFDSLGYLSPDALAAEMRRHHLFLFPSRDDGFGMVLSEALASGLRVAATTASGAPDLAAIVGDRIAIARADDAPDFVAVAQRQLRAIKSASPNERIDENVRQSLSWDGYVARYEAMLQTLVNDRHGLASGAKAP